MPPPSALSIATSAVQRLVKEERSYHTELEQQNKRLEKLLADPEADEYQLRQEVCQDFTILSLKRRAIEETKAVFPQLDNRIKDAIGKIELTLEDAKASGDESNAAEITKAEEVVSDAKSVLSSDDN
ncbi:MAG: hypothetical protein M1825_001707 [Sarcosagium campestre]|nr:MAG: hypothetical protein M1825_001707 [Sarcosagium campestre]